MPGYFIRPEWIMRFHPGKAIKEDLFAGRQLFVGLNCFEPGQSQPIHTHAGADKFYYVLFGKATITVGDESRDVEGGTLVWAPAGLAHGVSNVVEQTVLLVAIAPPPRS